MNVSYLHNMKFTKFIEGLVPQVIKMKKIFRAETIRPPSRYDTYRDIYLTIRFFRFDTFSN